VANGVLYIGSPDHSLATGAYSPHIYAYNASNGALLKSYTLGSQDGFNFPLLFVQGLIFYDRSAGSGPGVYYMNLVGLDIKTGKPAWSVYVGPTSTLEPQIVNDIIYAPGGDMLLAYAISGKLLHSYQTQTSSDASWTFTVVA
jgi:outer membrane protein assembly factor BamB